MLPNNDFWNKEDSSLWEGMDELVLAAILAGIAGGGSLLPPGGTDLLNDNIINSIIIAFLHQYRLQDIPGINATTRTQVINSISTWLRSGDDLSALETALASIFGNSRAAMIAATEITRLFAIGNEIIWNASGVVSGKKWVTARDERVCPICGPLDGLITELNASFPLGIDIVADSPQMRKLLGEKFSEELSQRRASSLLGSVGTIQRPPAHQRCRCWEQPVVSEIMFRDVIRGLLQ